MFRTYRGVVFDPNQDLSHKRRKLYNMGTAILNKGNDDDNHNKKNKNKKMSKKEYIERLEMQEKWFAHYGRNKWY